MNDGGKWCYPGTDVLINKYDIKDKDLLDRLEIQKVMAKILRLDIKPDIIKATCNETHLISLNKFLFGEIYEWAGKYRDENIFKSERVLSGGSAEYSEHTKLEHHLKAFFEKYNAIDWSDEINRAENVTNFFSDLWSIHPFREGNTRTCTTYMWHFLREKGINIDLQLLRNNPMYVRDSLVMANYEQPVYLFNIIKDALSNDNMLQPLAERIEHANEKYQIAKEDYKAFKERYGIQKEQQR